MFQRKLTANKEGPHDPETAKKRAKEKWKALQSKLHVKLQPISFVQNVGYRYAWTPSDDWDTMNKKGALVLTGFGFCILGLIMAGFFAIYSEYWLACFPLGFTICQSLALVYFIKVKHPLSFVRILLFLLWLFPLLFDWFSSSFGTVSLWSFLAPVGSILYNPGSSSFWFASFLLSNVLLLGVQSSFNFAFNSFNTLLLICILYFVILHHSSHLVKHTRELGVVNTLLRSHNKKLANEKEELKEEFDRLTKRNDPVANSPAEKMISILKKFQEECPSEFLEDLEFVIHELGSGKDLYIPDINQLLDCFHEHVDKDTRAYLLRFQPGHDILHHVKVLNEPNASQEHIHAHIVNPPNIVEDNVQLNKLLESIDEWNLEIFEINQVTGGHPLYHVAQTLFRKHNLLEKFAIPEQCLHNFLIQVENLYQKENPYHNNVHAADVAHSINFMLTHVLRRIATDEDIFASIVAALIHDLDHPGVNNNFEIRTRSKLALLYNDISILENHHLAAAFSILSYDGNDIFIGCSPELRHQLRSIIIDMVLATDFGKHLEVLGQFNARRLAADFPSQTKEDRALCLKMALKCCDIGHTAKRRDIHLQWTQRITEEFFLQGDKEKKLGLPISSAMDRNNTDLGKSQFGFINFLVLPLYKSFVDQFEEVRPCLNELLANLDHWEKVAKSSSKEN